MPVIYNAYYQISIIKESRLDVSKTNIICSKVNAGAAGTLQRKNIQRTEK